MASETPQSKIHTDDDIDIIKEDIADFSEQTDASNIKDGISGLVGTDDTLKNLESMSTGPKTPEINTKVDKLNEELEDMLNEISSDWHSKIMKEENNVEVKADKDLMSQVSSPKTEKEALIPEDFQDFQETQQLEKVGAADPQLETTTTTLPMEHPVEDTTVPHDYKSFVYVEAPKVGITLTENECTKLERSTAEIMIQPLNVEPIPSPKKRVSIEIPITDKTDVIATCTIQSSTQQAEPILDLNQMQENSGSSWVHVQSPPETVDDYQATDSEVTDSDESTGSVEIINNQKQAILVGGTVEDDDNIIKVLDQLPSPPVEELDDGMSLVIETNPQIPPTDDIMDIPSTNAADIQSKEKELLEQICVEFQDKGSSEIRTEQNNNDENSGNDDGVTNVTRDITESVEECADGQPIQASSELDIAGISVDLNTNATSKAQDINTLIQSDETLPNMNLGKQNIRKETTPIVNDDQDNIKFDSDEQKSTTIAQDFDLEFQTISTENQIRKSIEQASNELCEEEAQRPPMQMSVEPQIVQSVDDEVRGKKINDDVLKTAEIGLVFDLEFQTLSTEDQTQEPIEVIKQDSSTICDNGAVSPMQISAEPQIVQAINEEIQNEDLELNSEVINLQAPPDDVDSKQPNQEDKEKQKTVDDGFEEIPLNKSQTDPEFKAKDKAAIKESPEARASSPKFNRIEREDHEPTEGTSDTVKLVAPSQKKNFCRCQ